MLLGMYEISQVPIWLANGFRGFSIFVGPFCLVLCYRLVRQSHIARHRKYVYVGAAFLAMSVMYTQAERWNEVPTPRVFLAALGMAFLLLGLLTMRKYDTEDV